MQGPVSAAFTFQIWNDSLCKSANVWQHCKAFALAMADFYMLKDILLLYNFLYFNFILQLKYFYFIYKFFL